MGSHLKPVSLQIKQKVAMVTSQLSKKYVNFLSVACCTISSTNELSCGAVNTGKNSEIKAGNSCSKCNLAVYDNISS